MAEAEGVLACEVAAIGPDQLLARQCQQPRADLRTQCLGCELGDGPTWNSLPSTRRVRSPRALRGRAGPDAGRGGAGSSAELSRGPDLRPPAPPRLETAADGRR